MIREPRFECPAYRIEASSSRWAGIHAEGKAGVRSDTGAFTATGDGLQIVGRPLTFAIEGDAASMHGQLALHGLKLPQVSEFLTAQKLPVPELQFTGIADIDLELTRQDQQLTAGIKLQIADGAYQNADYTLVGEKLNAAVQATVNLGTTPITFEARIASASGQALAGPVLLDFGKNPMRFTASGSYAPGLVQITQFRDEHTGLAILTGNARIRLTPFAVQDASIDATDVRFPAAYASFMQIALATTPFNQLDVSGTAAMHLQLRDNNPVQLDLAVHDLAFSDASRDLKVDGVSSEIHWTAGLTGPPRPSWLAWEKSQGWGIVGARSRLDFVTQDREFRLTQPARLPFFDGALRINTLAAEHIGTDAISGVFDAVIEPISVAPIARALDLPEFAGQLAGTIPGLTYRDKLLSVQGNIEADVFGGHVVASNLRIREPLGAWPRLYGDVIARNLDLELLTGTFKFGGITGRLDVDLKGLRDLQLDAGRLRSDAGHACGRQIEASHQPARRAESLGDRRRRRRCRCGDAIPLPEVLRRLRLRPPWPLLPAPQRHLPDGRRRRRQRRLLHPQGHAACRASTSSATMRSWTGHGSSRRSARRC